MEFKRYELENRAVLLTENLPYARTVAVGFWNRFGARCENAETLGAAHFIEHMLFKGTADMGPMDIAVAFESAGSSFNAAASKENTRLYARCLSDQLPNTVKLLSDMTLRSTFPADEFERERGVVLEEIKANMDVPEDVAYDLFFEDFFPGHGLGNNILGTDESIAGMTRDGLFDIFREAYRPAHLIITIAGNLADHDLESIVTRELGPDSAPPCDLLGSPPAPDSVKTNLQIVNRDTNLVQLYFGFPGIPYSNEQRYAYGALDMILSGGMSSRLFQEVREKRGLVYDISSDNVNYTDSGVFYVCAGTRPENLMEVMEITVAELQKMRNGDVSEAELERVKVQYRAGMEMSYENVVSRMVRLARNQIYFGRYQTDEELLESMQSVTVDDVTAAAENVFHRHPLVFTALGPFGEDGSHEIQKQIVDVLDKL